MVVKFEVLWHLRHLQTVSVKEDGRAGALKGCGGNWMGGSSQGRMGVRWRLGGAGGSGVKCKSVAPTRGM